MTRRWSLWAFLIIVLAGFAGPYCFSHRMEDQVAPAFSKPLWLDRDRPATKEIVLKGKESEALLKWAGGVPAGFKITGTVTFESPGKARLIWKTPQKSYRLKNFRRKKSSITINIDARDVSFKSALGIGPFDDPMEALFPSDGNYSFQIESDQKIIDSDVKLRLPGARWGLLGTDQRGRDVLHLFLAGIRISLLIGISATIIASIVGLTMGMISGYMGGYIDSIIMRTVDVLMSIPTLPILMVLATIWGKGLVQLIIILSIFSWMGTARAVRSMVLVVRDSSFVEGLRAIGASTAYILRRHILPEALPLLLANIALGVPGTILSEASLSFLGLSDPRLPSWGRMLHEAYGFGAFSAHAWWLIIPPGLGIAVICLIFMDLGKFLEEKIDPDLTRES